MAEAYIHGTWTAAQSGKRFDVEDPGSGKSFASCPDFGGEDIDSVVQSSARAFQDFRKENPHTRAKKLLKWERLILQNKEDIAQILTHEAGKPLPEARDEIDYALGFTWWFAGEAKRIRGNISVPSNSDRRVFIVK